MPGYIKMAFRKADFLDSPKATHRHSLLTGLEESADTGEWKRSMEKDEVRHMPHDMLGVAYSSCCLEYGVAPDQKSSRLT